MAKTTDYVVTTNMFSYVGDDEDNTPSYAEKGETVALTKEQAERGLKLGALRKASDVADDEDPGEPVASQAAESEGEEPQRLPEGQSDPSSLAQRPDPQRPPKLTAVQVAAMQPSEVVGWLSDHPDHAESILEIEKEGQDRDAVKAAAESLLKPDEPEERAESDDKSGDDDK